MNIPVELHGKLPDESYKASVEGYIVPYVRIRRPSPVEYTIVLDERMAFELDGDEQAMKDTIIIVANALAIGAGFTCFGQHRRPMDRFGVRVMQIDKMIGGDEGRDA